MNKFEPVQLAKLNKFEPFFGGKDLGGRFLKVEFKCIMGNDDMGLTFPIFEQND